MLHISQVVDHKPEALPYAFRGAVRHPVHALHSSAVGYLRIRKTKYKGQVRNKKYKPIISKAKVKSAADTGATTENWTVARQVAGSGAEIQQQWLLQKAMQKRQRRSRYNAVTFARVGYRAETVTNWNGSNLRFSARRTTTQVVRNICSTIARV